MTNSEPHIGVIGAGAWGTALAMLANRSGSHVTLWTRNEQVISAVTSRRENAQYLPDIFIDPAIGITSDNERLTHCDILIITIPAQSLRTVAISLSDMVRADIPLIIATKGIERGSLMLMSEIIQSIMPHNPYAILSGPNFAREIAEGKPAASVLATHYPQLAEQVGFALGGKYFRLYSNDDPIGTQVGGALKNVLAIAAGIIDGRGMGENARAALITRGIGEMARFAKAKGGKEETLMGLAGFGDILLSCTSTKSRNYALGAVLGRIGSASLSDSMLTRATGLTEGVATAESIARLARTLGVTMPILCVVHEVLSGQLSIDAAIERLLGRPPGHEG